MRSCNCPSCGAQLKIKDDSRDYVFCEFCGTQVDLMDSRTVHVEYIFDEAKVKDAEARMKDAENKSRIINAFTAPIEEKQRQKEFERQQQLEAERRQFEREEAEKQRIHERELEKERYKHARHQRMYDDIGECSEAIEDGCAAVAGGCLVKCFKHPIAALIIIVALLYSCMGPVSSSSYSHSSNSKTSTSSEQSSSSLEMYSDKYLTNKQYSYDVAYIRHSDATYVYLISYSEHIATFVNMRTDFAVICDIEDDSLSTGICITYSVPVAENVYTSITRTIKESDSGNDSKVLVTKDDGESLLFEKTDVSTAEEVLYSVSGIYDYRN